MTAATMRSYSAEVDYMRIRRFLIDTFALYRRPYNWTLTRWNFLRYAVLPMHSYYNVQYFGVPTGTVEPVRDEQKVWERTISIWETSGGEIAGVVHTENEEPGEAWFQLRPSHGDLCEEMVVYAEDHLTNWVDDLGYIKLYADDDSPLVDVAQARGYRRLDHAGAVHKVYELDDLPEPELPDGYLVKSVAEEDDVEKMRALRTLAFGGALQSQRLDAGLGPARDTSRARLSPRAGSVRGGTRQRVRGLLYHLGRSRERSRQL